MTSDKPALSTFCFSAESTIRDVLGCIDRSDRGIALMIDGTGHLLATVTDGDVRRAILDGRKLAEPASELLNYKGSAYKTPITASVKSTRAAMLQLMQERDILQLPLLDESGVVVELITMDELLPEDTLPIQAVIMAGGFGTRLRPLTEDLPKPTLPIGDRPIMQHIIDGLRGVGIRRVNVTTHFQPEKITEYFGNGQEFGVELNYVEEDRPLGTAGALSLMQTPDEPLLVINGDILTQVDFRAMLAFHRENHAELTVGVRRYEFQIPYGVIETEGARVKGLQEKPELQFLVNAGIYLLEPSVHTEIPHGQRFDMTDLIEKLLAAGRTVTSFPIVEYWLDIGQPGDYERAQEDIKNFGKKSSESEGNQST